MSPPNTDNRCLACGGKTFYLPGRLPAPNRVVCTQQGCVFSGQGLESAEYSIMKRLLADRYKAGYHAGLDDVSSTLNKLEKHYVDRAGGIRNTKAD